jgi:hypothetical protein
MEDNSKVLESLMERVTEYGKTSLELVKLKTIDKTTDVVSSVIPHSFVVALIASFMFFFNMGLAFWLGDILGRVYYGFFIMAVFYGLTGVILHFFMHKWLKKHFGNYIIKQVLK